MKQTIAEFIGGPRDGIKMSFAGNPPQRFLFPFVQPSMRSVFDEAPIIEITYELRGNGKYHANETDRSRHDQTRMVRVVPP